MRVPPILPAPLSAAQVADQLAGGGEDHSAEPSADAAAGSGGDSGSSDSDDSSDSD